MDEISIQYPLFVSFFLLLFFFVFSLFFRGEHLFGSFFLIFLEKAVTIVVQKRKEQ